MPQPLDTRVLAASVAFTRQALRRPLQLSSGPIRELTEAVARIRVRVGGREAEGRGSIYLSDLWAWPDPAISHADRDAALRGLCERIAARLDELAGGEPAHPMELGLRLHARVCDDKGAPDAAEEASGHPVPPVLARAMALSPFDAALHDATGRALGRSAFALYGEAAAIPSADPLFGGVPAGRAVAAALRPVSTPARASDAWLVVGKDDALPEDLRPWVVERGYRALKLKLLGRDPEADAARTAAVYRAARALGATRPRLVGDSNEANPDAASVVAYLDALRRRDAEAFAALEYLEQPTARDIRAHPHDWRGVARVKPVLLDEGLTGPDRLADAEAQGWSGVAVKTCKGHSFALAAAAWALSRGRLVSLQDLTNPGLALIHAAAFAAHVPTINGVELNSPQFTPDANAAWLPRLATLFAPRDGTHALPPGETAGLGSEM